MKRDESQVPKARLLKDVLVRIKAAYPDAALSEDMVRRLYPVWVKLWRKGFNAEHIAATTCSCNDGRTIEPSLAADLDLGNVKLRVPKGAQPGVPFGFEALRESGARNKLLQKVTNAEQSINYYTVMKAGQENALTFARGRARKRHERLIETYTQAIQQWQVQLVRAQEALRVFDEGPEVPAPRRTRKAAPPAPAPVVSVTAAAARKRNAAPAESVEARMTAALKAKKGA